MITKPVILIIQILFNDVIFEISSSPTTETQCELMKPHIVYFIEKQGAVILDMECK